MGKRILEEADTKLCKAVSFEHPGLLKWLQVRQPQDVLCIPEWARHRSVWFSKAIWNGSFPAPAAGSTWQRNVNGLRRDGMKEGEKAGLPLSVSQVKDQRLMDGMMFIKGAVHRHGSKSNTACAWLG